MALTAGTRLGPYEVETLIGAGGMGEVYQARDTQLERRVALKLLSAERAREPRALARFRQEARLVAALDHPYICTVYEIGTTPDGQPFMTMPLYCGTTLRRRLAGGALSAVEALAIGTKVAEGIAYAHEHGVVHRDITPANVFVLGDGGIKILDFGLAILQSRGVTTASRVAGTMAYMSPEQLLGGDVDARTDVWAIGVLLYEMTTGRSPFEGNSEHTMIDAILHEAPASLTELEMDLPVLLENVVFHCLQKQAAHRYPSAVELLVDLKQLEIAPRTATPLLVPASPPLASGTQLEVAVLCAVLGDVGCAAADDLSALAQLTLELGETIRQRHGALVSYNGADTVCAVFGTTMSDEEAPAQAVSVAESLPREVARLTASHAVKTKPILRVVVHSGRVVVAKAGRDGPGTALVAGEAIDEALRLARECPSNKVVVTSANYRQTGKLFRYGPPSTGAAPERRPTTPLYELLSLEYSDVAWGRLLAETPLVGREREMDQLRLSIYKLLNGEGSIVSLVGAAGAGKSRLVREIRQKEEMCRAAVVAGRALPFGQHLSFLPLIGVLQQWAGIAAHEDVHTAFEKLEHAVRWSLSPSDLKEVLPFVAVMMGLELPEGYRGRIRGIEGQALERLICLNLRRLFAEVARRRPLMIVLEDLHWADASTIDLLNCVFRLVPETPVLFMLTCRPDSASTQRLLTAVHARHHSSYTEIELGPLSPVATESMLEHLLRDINVPPSARSDLMRKSGGNPFFVEELVRALAVVDASHLTAGESTAVPDTLATIIQHRLAALEPGAQALLKVMAVNGPSAPHVVLAAIAGRDIDLERELRHLADAEVLVTREHRGQREHVFQHALVQQVVYERIAPEERAGLHRRIAEAIERLFEARLQEFSGMLAYHYGHAADAERAYLYLMRAGDHALQTSASIEAAQYYTDALSLYLREAGRSTDAVKVAALEKNIALAYYNKGMYSDAVTHFDRLHPHLLGPVPRGRAAKAIVAITGLLKVVIGLYLPQLKWRRQPSAAEVDWINLFYCKLLSMGHLDARRVIVEGLLLAGKVTEFDLRKVRNGIAMFAGLSLAFSWTGLSLRFSRRILSFLADKLDPGDDKAQVYFATDRLTSDFFSGIWREGALDRQVVSQGLKIGETFSLANFVIFHGRIAIERGQYSEAEHCINTLEEIGTSFDHDYPIALAYFLRAKLSMKYGRDAEGLEASAKGLAVAGQLGLSTLVLGLHAIRARLFTRTANSAGASTELAYAMIAAARANATPCYRSELLLARVEHGLTLRAGERKPRRLRSLLATARTAARTARVVASDQAEAYRLLGACYFAAGRVHAAARCWRRSLEVADRLGARLELAKTHAEIARRLSTEGAPSRCAGLEADEHNRRAAALFAEIGAYAPLR